MSGLAKVLLEQGCPVSGSDLADSKTTRRLVRLGAQVFQGHEAANLADDVATVVVSTAVRADNPELVAARERGLEILHRADLLARLMAMKKGIAVAGAHGKTTTSAMISVILEQSGWDPAIVVGGELQEIDGNGKWGQGDYLVAEADESDGSFVKLHPWMAVITNIEDDHLDHYQTVAAIEAAFEQFTDNVARDGWLVLCDDDPRLREMACRRSSSPIITYGLNPTAEYHCRDLTVTSTGTAFEVYHRERCLGRIMLPVPGLHNVSNALAAIACADRIGLDFALIAGALASFRGAGRRFQWIGEEQGVRVVDDYAHHPTEVKATLAAARQLSPQRLICVFQPHRYTRTQAQYIPFGAAFDDADLVVLNEIYAAGEAPIPGVAAALIADGIGNRSGKAVPVIADKGEIVAYLAGIAQPGDLIMTMGAGHIWTVGPDLLACLKERGGKEE